jgi:Uma2 family endonuclease
MVVIQPTRLVTMMAWLAAAASPSVAYDMVSARRNSRVTAHEFLSHPAARGKSELVRGEINSMTPASGMHGLLAGEIFVALKTFVDSRSLGVCFPGNTGFELPGLDDTVRSPDAAFICANRLPRNSIGSRWVKVAPDLVVEVLSPSETTAELDAKWRDYRAAGTTVMWVIDPTERVVTVRETGAPGRRLSAGDVLDGGKLLPGFSLSIAKLFERLAR